MYINKWCSFRLRNELREVKNNLKNEKAGWRAGT
jgi:hypothetical protein